MSYDPTDVYNVAPEGLGWHLDITDPTTRHPIHCHISSAQAAYMAEQDRARQANDYAKAGGNDDH